MTEGWGGANTLSLNYLYNGVFLFKEASSLRITTRLCLVVAGSSEAVVVHHTRGGQHPGEQAVQ